MNEYPRMMYKAGGNEEMHGGKFATRIVGDEDEQSSAAADGWYTTTCAASSPPEVAALGEDAPPTREEMEQEAQRLGIQFHHRIGDSKLAALIEQASKA